MKFKYFFLISGFVISCSSNAKFDQKSSLNFQRYELAYNTVTEKENKLQPFLEEYHSDASGVKIIPKIFILKKYSVYGSENFKVEKSYGTNEITKLSKKYTNKKWRKDRAYRVLKAEEVKKFHGPLKYMYFSEIKNDSLRADILGNPFAEYSMTTGEHCLIIFENDSIKSIQKTISNYD